MSESGSQHGEANKEEGAIAYRLAKRALEEGNVERASRLAEKAARLYPGQRQVEDLLEAIQRRQNGQDADAGGAQSEQSGPAQSEQSRGTSPGRARRQNAGSSAQLSGDKLSSPCTLSDTAAAINAPASSQSAPPASNAGAAPSGSSGGTAEQRQLVEKILRTKDFFEILGVPNGSGEDEVKKAYRKLALKLHPDKCRAPNAAEAFKALSRAFSVLTDPGKRAEYLRYGHEDGPAAAAAANGNGRTPGRRQQHYYEQEINPEDIFQAFFGGGFGGGPFGPQVRMHRHVRPRKATDSSPRCRYSPAAAELYGPARDCTAAPHPTPGVERGQQQRRQQEQQPVDPFRQLLQVLPILLFFLFTMLPGVFEREPPYQLHRTQSFQSRQQTGEREVPYFVKSAEVFELKYPPQSQKRARVEQEIEYEYRVELHTRCQREQIREAQAAYYAKPGTRRAETRKSACEEYSKIFGAGGYYMM